MLWSLNLLGKKNRIEEEILQAHRGVKYINDHQALLICSIEKRDKTRSQEISNAEHTCTLTIYRVDGADNEEKSKMTKEMEDLGIVVDGKDKHKFLALNAKFEEILKAYVERGNMIIFNTILLFQERIN